MVWYFFFQAEDGIRDLVRSRGLGDVYKRQVLRELMSPRRLRPNDPTGEIDVLRTLATVLTVTAVSYTHLTLPTSDLG